MNNSNRKKSSIQLGRQMMVTSILVSIAPLLVITSVLFYLYNVAYTDKVVAYMEEMAKRQAQMVDTFLVEKLANIRMLAVANNVEELKDDQYLTSRLEALKQVYIGCYNDLGIIDSQGHQVTYAGPYRLQKADYSDASWFKQAITKPSYISDVFLGIRRIPHFIVTTRMTENEHPWLLRATIDFAEFNMLVKSIQIGSTGHAFIINRHGEFQTELRIKNQIDPELVQTLISQDFKGTKAAFFEKPNTRGEEYFFVCTPLKDGEWILVFQQAKSDALKHLINARWIAATIVVLGSICIVLTVVVLAGRMEHRLTKAEKDHKSIQKQMVEAGKLAAIGELAAGIAHEINNPVAIMIENAGWVEDLIAEDDFDKNREEIDDSLKEITIQGRRCKEITHKLLSFARRTDSRIGVVNVNELLEEIISFSAQKAKYGKVTVAQELSPDLPSITISPTELQQVILNLVNNAIDAISGDEGKVIIRTRREGEFIVIDVADNGQGIPPANLHRIFEPFYTTKPVGKGTGLGLAICYGIIQKMGGEITVESELGEGSVFHVTIPITKGEDQAGGNA